MTYDDNWLIIRPSKGWGGLNLNLRDLWHYRELALFLAWRDISIRYKQTVLGVAWILLQPILSTIIFTVIFGLLVKVPTGETPYALFALVGLLPWNFFAAALTRGGGSLLASTNLISKVYFPRIVIPIASLLSSLFDFVIVGLVTLLVLLIFGAPFTWSLLALPAFGLLTFLAALGVSLWLSALNVQYRDVGYLLPFLSQIWFYMTPVIYPVDLLPVQWRWVLGLNPMAGVVGGFRWMLLGSEWPGWSLLTTSILVTIILLVSGLLVFKRMERRFADVI